MSFAPCAFAHFSFVENPNLVPLPLHGASLFPRARSAARRCRPRVRLHASSCAPLPPAEQARSVDLPLLPFRPSEVLIPSEQKTLHLYEARYLALLEESLLTRKNAFVHFVLDPVHESGSSPGYTFAAKYGCLVHIESVKKLEIGALVSIRGICRIQILKLVQMEPYMRGVVWPIFDDNANNKSEVALKIAEMKECICSLNNLQFKLKVPKEEVLQTNIMNSLLWAENDSLECFDESFLLELAERVSFSPFQFVSGMSEAEMLDLQKEKLRAMESRNTQERLQYGIEYIRQSIKMAAARLAIQNL